MTYKLLIVDDEMPNLRLLQRLFSNDYQCLTASSGPEALRLLEQHDVAIVITDQRMPEMTGIELLKRSAQLRPHMVRILLTGYTEVEALVEALNCGLVYLYVTKPWNNDDLKLKINRACEHYESNRNRNSLASANDRLVRELRETKLAIVSALADMLRTRSQSEYDHAVRVRAYAQAIAERMTLNAADSDDLPAAALLHGLEDLFGDRSTSVRRTDDQYPMAREQSRCEARLLAAIPAAGNLNDIIKFHRENFDGTGPGRLKGEEIPQPARILRVADEYDSLIQPKSSLARLRHDEAMQFLLQRAGKQFDPRVIQIMSEINPEDLHRMKTSSIAGEYSASNEVGLAFVDAMAW